MNLVDRDRRVRAPCRAARPASTRRRARRTARGAATIEAVAGGVSVARASGSALCGRCMPSRADDVVLVARAGAEPGTKSSQTPDGWRSRIGWRRDVPAVEIADHRDARGVRRPDGEAHAADAVDGHRIRAERKGELELPALVEQMQVGSPSNGPKE